MLKCTLQHGVIALKEFGGYPLPQVGEKLGQWVWQPLLVKDGHRVNERLRATQNQTMYEHKAHCHMVQHRLR